MSGVSSPSRGAEGSAASLNQQTKLRKSAGRRSPFSPPPTSTSLIELQAYRGRFEIGFKRDQHLQPGTDHAHIEDTRAVGCINARQAGRREASPGKLSRLIRWAPARDLCYFLSGGTGTGVGAGVSLMVPADFSAAIPDPAAVFIGTSVTSVKPSGLITMATESPCLFFA